jgi:hypothetical protein
MPFNIELLSLGTDLYAEIEASVAPLNAAQTEFRFSSAPPRLRSPGVAYRRDQYLTTEVFAWLAQYRRDAKGHRPYIIAFINAPLESTRYSNLFGSHEAADGVAAEGSAFLPNLLLARAQIEQTYGSAPDGELLLVLTHHPPEWLVKDAADVFVHSLARQRHVHLCGHLHRAQARLVRDYGAQGCALRYTAGAAHGDPAEEKKHGYAWGAVRWNDAEECWEVGWAPRIFVEERGEMRADSTRYDLDQTGFAWERIDLRWPAPR